MTVPTRSLQKNWINVTMLMRIQLSIRNLYRHKHNHHPTRFHIFVVYCIRWTNIRQDNFN